MPDVKERIMSNRKYIKSLLLGMSVMMTILIAIQIYLTVYVLKHNEMLPRILSCTALILDIIILAVFFVSLRINADVDSMAYTDVTGITFLISIEGLVRSATVYISGRYQINLGESVFCAYLQYLK